MLGVGLLVNNIQRRYPLYWWTAKDVGRKKIDDVESVGEKRDLEDFEKEISREGRHFRHTITLGPDYIDLPEDFMLGQEEMDVLNILRDRLTDMSWKPASSSSTEMAKELE